MSRLLAEVPDRDLLERYVRHDDQGAFTQLVMRYNRLVWGQCRNMLANDADAEDAFQASFLTLARAAKKFNTEARLGPWLHGMAYRVCMNARRAIGRRAKREKAAARPDAQQPVADSSWEKAFAVVAEEVQKLPNALRVAFVLCYFEGRSVADAAADLGLKRGMFTARLTRAKQALLERLARRGSALEFWLWVQSRGARLSPRPRSSSGRSPYFLPVPRSPVPFELSHTK